LQSQGKGTLAQDMDRHRGDAFQARMNDGRQKARQQLKDLPNKPTVYLENNNLNAHRDMSYGVHANDSIAVCADARVGKTISTKLGGISRVFTADTNMDGAQFSHGMFVIHHNN